VEHHVRQRPLVDILAWGRAYLPKEVKIVSITGERLLVLLHHRESMIAESIADLDALDASLALGRIDEDSKEGSLFPLLLVDLTILFCLGPLGPDSLPLLIVGNGAQLGLKMRPRNRLAQDGGVGTLRYTGHAADTLFPVELRDLQRNVAEVAQGAGPGWDQAAGYPDIGRQALLACPGRICPDDPLVEVAHILLNVELQEPGWR